MFADLSEDQIDWPDKDQAEYLAERLDKLELDNEVSCEYNFYSKSFLKHFLAGAHDDVVTEVQEDEVVQEKG